MFASFQHGCFKFKAWHGRPDMVTLVQVQLTPPQNCPGFMLRAGEEGRLGA